ncbi:peptidylprolyl isomerase SurA [Vibrio sp. SS-MA-C1-2]|uniref:peptidylprolyl isomerase SurA n=1 Tax=Vibrio sp. SS-MA-C1-2 TaxID=2908646 RepID=UPI0038FCB059
MKNWKFQCAGILLALVSNMVSAAPQALDGVAVIVNNGVILQSDIDSALASIRYQNKDNAKLPPTDVLKKQVIDKLILDSLQEQQANAMGIQIDDTRLDQAIENIAKQNKTTVEQLRKNVEAEGITYTQYRSQVKKEMIVSEVRNAQVRHRINIIPQEVEALAKTMEQQSSEAIKYNLGHIQINVDTSNQASKVAAKESADKLVAQLKDGADFSNLAYTYSKGPKALQGGNWGWLSQDEMPTLFADQVAGHHKGDVVGPFLSGIGYHILKIEDVKGQVSVAATEVKSRHILLKTSIILSDQGAKKELNKYLAEIKSGKATFAELAKKYSDDPGSGVNGGELGWQAPEIYVPEFRDMIKKLPIGQISQPFKTVHGWHIVEVEGRRTVDKTDDALKNKAYNVLMRRKFNEEAQAWLKELRASAYIDYVNQDES